MAILIYALKTKQTNKQKTLNISERNTQSVQCTEHVEETVFNEASLGIFRFLVCQIWEGRLPARSSSAQASRDSEVWRPSKDCSEGFWEVFTNSSLLGHKNLEEQKSLTLAVN